MGVNKLEVLGDICICSGGTWGDPGTLTPIDNIENCQINLSKDKANASTRASVWKKYKGAMRELAATGTILFESGDTGFEALLDSQLNGTVLHLAFLDGPYSQVGAQGPHADIEVMKLDRKGEIEGLVAYDFEFAVAKTANDPAWLEIEA